MAERLARMVPDALAGAASRSDWPGVLSALLGAVLVAAGLLAGRGGPLRADALLVGAAIAALGAHDYARTRRGGPSHPDGLRLTALLALWVLGFSLTRWPAPDRALALVGLGVGVVGLVGAAAAYLARFKGDPGKRARARHGGPSPLADAIDGARATVETVRTGPTREYVLPILLAVPVGVGAGLGAAAFRYLMYLVHLVMFDVALPRLPSHLWIAVLPVVGGIVAGVLIHEFAPEAAGHGVPENMEAIADNGGRIRHRLPPFKVVVSAITLGAGGSGGREGPIARIGAGIGSSLGQLFDLSAGQTRLLLAAGIAGGIGATFGAVIGGIFFGIEIVMLYRVTAYNVVVLALTTLIAVGTAETIAPHFVWFSFLPFPLPQLAVTPMDVALALPYGLLMGLVAWVWVVLLDRTERVFEGLSLPNHVKPAIGAVPVGILGIYYAKYGVMGVGYHGLRLAVSDVQVGALLLLALAVSKLVATQFTIGTGGSGGVFAPTLYIGGLFAVGVHHLVGALPVSAALLGIVGMGAIFSGSAFAPLTSMFLIAEVFNDYSLVAILAVPCLLSYAVSRSLLGASIYTSRLRRKGILDGYPERAAEIGPPLDGEAGQGDQPNTPSGRQAPHPSD